MASMHKQAAATMHAHTGRLCQNKAVNVTSVHVWNAKDVPN